MFSLLGKEHRKKICKKTTNRCFFVSNGLQTYDFHGVSEKSTAKVAVFFIDYRWSFRKRISSTLPVTLSFLKMAPRWALTVRLEMLSISAICAVLLPL